MFPGKYGLVVLHRTPFLNRVLPSLLRHYIPRQSHELLRQLLVLRQFTSRLDRGRRTNILARPMRHRRRIQRAQRAFELVLLEHLQTLTHRVSGERVRLVNIVDTHLGAHDTGVRRVG